MAWPRRFLALLGAVMLLGVATPAVHAATDGETPGSSQTIGTVAVRACGLIEMPGSQAWCGTLQRPWDPAVPSLGSFPLAFSILLPKSAATTAPAVVGMEGGPGYGSIGSGQTYAEMLGPLLRDRALLVVDARGTGRSDAAVCPSLAGDGIGWGRAVAECARHLGARAQLYASALAADDIAALVGALGLGPVDVYGDSYGTFLAQVMASHHPDIVRSLVLDGAYPVTGETAWYPTQGPALRESFTVVCLRTPACAALPGSTMARLRTVLDTVRKAPATVRAPGADGRMHRIVIDAPALVATLFNGTYLPITYRETDAALRAALRDDWLPLGRLVAEFWYDGSGESSVRQFSPAQQLAVSCHDYPQLFAQSASIPERRRQIAAAIRAEKQSNPGLYGPFTIDEYLDSDWSAIEVCTTWPAVGTDPARLPGPLSGSYPDIPALVLSGQLDTITTPAEGAMVARQFPRARQVIVANGLHVTAMGDPDGCAAGLVRDFLRDYAQVLAEPLDRCAIPPVRGAPGYPRTAERIDLPVAVALTIADVLDRAWQTYGSSGLGLRGGSWSLRGWPRTTLTLEQYQLYDGLPVSGKVRWDVASGALRATLVAAGRSWTARWNTEAWRAQATVTEVNRRGETTTTFPAP
ncbi:MAG: alpha/beta fold hydrolase [Actinomycetota bacterium]|nr:alpha/beta fold hydrolase [Actinomycetota bacterium]